MAFHDAILLLVLALIPLTMAKDNQTLGGAIQEMQRANYFGFVMLLNMLPSDSIPTNITFLMPNNRVLANASIPENDVLDFLLRHSIPSPLRFDHLNHFPTGSIIPSSEPNFKLTVVNNGRRSFFLNNVKLISPDICLAGSSVRCHGIDGVLLAADMTKTPVVPVPDDSPPANAPPPSPDVMPGDGYNLAPAATPQPAGPDPTSKKSGSSGLVAPDSVRLTVYCILALLLSRMLM